MGIDRVEEADHLILGAISLRIQPRNSLYSIISSLSLSNSPKIMWRLSFFIALMK